MLGNYPTYKQALEAAEHISLQLQCVSSIRDVESALCEQGFTKVDMLTINRICDSYTADQIAKILMYIPRV